MLLLVQKVKLFQTPYSHHRLGQAAINHPNEAQVIIVPIYWNRKADEKAKVLASAEHLETLAKGWGLNVLTDLNEVPTPGQKFKYW